MRALLALVLLLAAAAPAAAGDFTTRAAPSIGMGLSGIADWATEQPFLDLMKSARPWVGHRPGQWGGWTEADLARAGALDASGWPKRIPKELTGLSTLILTDQPEASRSLARRYRLTYAGRGTLAVEGRATNVAARPGEITFDYAPGPGSVILTLTATDPRDPLRDMSVIAEADRARAEKGEIFNPRFLARIGGVRALRFMDWMDTNNSTQSAWSGRPKPGDYTWARAGVPLEVMVALANRLGADPWFNMPHRATDAYVRAFAEYARDHLDPRRHVYVEYSNELWNWGFDQAAYARDAARRRWGAGAPEDAWMQYAGIRAAEVAGIWTAAFGPRARDRLTRVIATQTDWPGLEKPLLEAPLYLAESPRNRPPAAAFDAYGVTGYFGAALGGEKAPLVRSWLGQPKALARALAELDDGRLSGDPAGSIADLTGRLWPYHAQAARAHGLDLVIYEGGTHVVGQGEAAEDPALTDFFIALNYSEGMGKLYSKLLDGWRAAGGTLFTAFVDVAGPSQWGSWGALRHLDDDTARWRALTAFNAAHPAWWDTRPAADFSNR